MAHISGEFTGMQHGWGDQPEPRPLCWTLSLLDKNAQGVGSVLAVGAGFTEVSSGEAGPTRYDYCLIRGACDFKRGTVELTVDWETHGGSPDAQERFSGSLDRDGSGSVTMSGTWSGAGGEGRFELTLARDGTNVSGAWVGQSFPGPEFKASIPANPITWAMSVRRSPAQGKPRVYGAGFFDDAGDIPGIPVLFFLIKDTYVSPHAPTPYRCVRGTSSCLLPRLSRAAVAGRNPGMHSPS